MQRVFLVSTLHIARRRVHGVSDKHVILIASWCYYLMLPRAQVIAAGGETVWGSGRGERWHWIFCTCALAVSDLTHMDTRWRYTSGFELRPRRGCVWEQFLNNNLRQKYCRSLLCQTTTKLFLFFPLRGINNYLDISDSDVCYVEHKSQY